MAAVAAPASQLLSFGQIGRRLGVSRWTLRDWILSERFPRHTHALPEIKSPTQRRRWDVAVVDEWTEDRRLGPTVCDRRAVVAGLRSRAVK